MKKIPENRDLTVFYEAFNHLMTSAETCLNNINEDKLANMFDIVIKAKNKQIVVLGQGRSLESLLLAADCLEHNGFPIILPSTNANLRPCVEGDVLFINTGSAKGSIREQVRRANEEIKMTITGMTANEEFAKEYPNVLFIPLNEKKNAKYAPLGTEFEFTTVILGSLIGYAVADTVENSLKNYHKNKNTILDLFKMTYEKFQSPDMKQCFSQFINLINTYIPKSNGKKIYFLGVGRDTIVARVAAIRYGHLHKEPDLDLKVIYDGHWDLRESGDLVILISGSGSTSQTMDYAVQGFISGTNIFAFTFLKSPTR